MVMPIKDGANKGFTDKALIKKYSEKCYEYIRWQHQSK